MELDMPILEDNKFTFDDFASFDAIDSWWSQYIEYDKEGYTPIGASILNGAPQKCIAYVMQLYTFNGKPESSSYSKSSPFRDISADKSKGKSPLEIACLVMNADSANRLIHDYFVYQLLDEDGNAVPKLTCYGDPLTDTDKDGNVTKEYFMYSSVPLWEEYTKVQYKYSYNEDIGIRDDYKYKCCECTNADILAASILPKPDILIKFVTSPRKLSEVTDSSGNNPLIFACLANCYESVDLLLNFSEDDEDRARLVNNKNSDDASALSIALLSNDQILIRKLNEFVSIDDLLRDAFGRGDHLMINETLLNILPLKNDNIYNWYDKSYPWSDGVQKFVAQYIEDENNSDLYELFNNNNYSYETHFSLLENRRYYHIIAVLYKNNKLPFSPATAKFNVLVDDHPLIYADTVKILFDDGAVTLDQILGISNVSKRNACVDKIFVLPYNKSLFSSLVMLDASMSYRNYVISYLYNNHYFTLQNLADISGDEISDDDLFDIVELLGVSLSIIDSDISNGEFKKNLVIYLFNQNDVTLANIDNYISSSALKKAIIIDLFNDPESHVSVEDILSLSSSTACSVINSLYASNDLAIPEDAYIIYNNYSDSLSDLNNDLKPLIGCMKFTDSVELASDYFWAYKFNNHTRRNWFNPMSYQSSTPPITDSLLKPVDGTRYKNVVVRDNYNDRTFRPSLFRLAKYNNKPEFYTDEEFTATGINNGMVVSFNSSVVNYKFQLPSDMYSIVNNQITWNSNHALCDLLSGSRCYTDDDIQVAIVFNNDHESITEGNSVTRKFKLSAKPRSDVILNISTNKVWRLGISSDRLTFTKDNWMVEQEVTFVAVDDSTDNGNVTAVVTVEVISSDTRYNGIVDGSLYFVIIDNDIAGVSYQSSSIELTEGNSTTRKFKLNTKPSNDVTLTFTFNYSSRLSVTPASLTFTQSNWNVERVVTFKAINNETHDGDIVDSVTIGVSSSDTTYNNITTTTITVNIKDDDTSVFGTLAFESDYFAVDTDPDYKLPILQKTKGAKPMHNTTSEWMKLVKTQWGDQYRSETDYAPYQVPKSPKPGKPFEYDLIYDEHINVDDE